MQHIDETDFSDLIVETDRIKRLVRSRGTTFNQGRINLRRGSGMLASGWKWWLCIVLIKCSIGWLKLWPISSEISVLCEISDPLLFVSYFASQSKGIKFGVYFFDACCVN